MSISATSASTKPAPGFGSGGFALPPPPEALRRPHTRFPAPWHSRTKAKRFNAHTDATTRFFRPSMRFGTAIAIARRRLGSRLLKLLARAGKAIDRLPDSLVRSRPRLRVDHLQVDARSSFNPGELVFPLHRFDSDGRECRRCRIVRDKGAAVELGDQSIELATVHHDHAHACSAVHRPGACDDRVYLVKC